MNKIEKVLYRAQATANGGRDGRATTTDKVLDVQLSTPKELGYSACFLGAMKFVAAQNKQTLPPDTTVTGKVGIGQIPGGFGIEVDLNVSVPGMERAEAEKLVEAAHGVCPYSNATRGNIEVRLSVV